MATKKVNLVGQSYTNGGWLPGAARTNVDYYATIGSESMYVGYNPTSSRMTAAIVKFTIPSVTGPTNSRSFKARFRMIRAGSASTTPTLTLYITDATRKETSYFATEPMPQGTILSQVSRKISPLEGSTYHYEEFTLPAGSDFVNGGTYYLWMKANTLAWTNWNFDSYIEMTYTETTSVGAPTSVTVGGSSSGTHIKVPGSSITVAWSGASSGHANSITGYHVNQKIGSGSWSQIATVSTSSTSGTTSVTVPSSSYRGQTVSYQVRTIGSAGSSYYSGYKTSSANVKVNSLPAAPSVSASRSVVPSTGGTVSFTTSAGADPDGQSLSVRYRVGTSGGWSNYSSGTNITVSAKTTYQFVTFDGLEYGSTVSRTIDKNTAPVVSSVTVNVTAFPAGPSGSGASGVSLGKDVTSTTLSMNKTGFTPQWWVKLSSTSNMSNPLTYPVHTGKSWSGTPIHYQGGKAGSYFQVGARFNDGVEDSAIKWGPTWRAPLPPSNGTQILVYNRPNATSNVPSTITTHYESGLTVRWKTATVEAGQIALQESAIAWRLSRDNGKTWEGPYGAQLTGSTASGANNEISYAFSGVPRGGLLKLIIWTVDKAGNISTKDWNTTYMRAKAPAIGSTLSRTLGTIKPYTHPDTTPEKLSIGRFSNDNNPVWYVDAMFGTDLIIRFVDGEADGTSTTKKFTIDGATLKSKLKHSSLKTGNVWNSVHTNVRFRAFLQDKLGVYSNVIYTPYFTVDFREPPQMSGSATTSINYDPLKEDLLVPTTESQTNNLMRIVNSNEFITLSFDRPTDYNEDITTYLVGRARQATKPTSLPNASSFLPFDSIPVSQAVNYMDGTTPKTKITFTVGPIDTSEFYYFSVQALDSKQLKSSTIYGNTYVVSAPTSSPDIRIEGVVDSSKQVVVTYSIDDFGGSRFSNSDYGYDGKTEGNNYPSFERALPDYIKRMTILVEHSTKGNFEDAIAQSFNIVDESNQADSFWSHKEGQLVTLPVPEAYGQERVYIRAKITFTTSTNNEISSYSTSVTFYPEAPTLSKRPNWIGINTNLNAPDEVFQVSDHSEKQYIRFKGSDGVKDYVITINLKEGSIDGAVIDGGSW